MTVQITRRDPLAGIPHCHADGVLSIEQFETWEEAVASLQARDIPVTEEHAREFRAHPDTQFTWDEFINAGATAYSCRVHYDIREVSDLATAG